MITNTHPRKVLLILILVALIFMVCSYSKKANSDQIKGGALVQKNEKSEFPERKNILNLTLNSTKGFGDYGFCSVYFEVENLGNLNITSLYLPLVFKENDGTILAKRDLSVDHVKPLSKTTGDVLVNTGRGGCANISQIDVDNINRIEIDGDLKLRRKEIPNISIHSKSLMSQIAIKSSGGEILVTEAVPVKTADTPKNFEKVDAITLALQYRSNPFKIRKRLGQAIETIIFLDKFFDEGNKARLIDGNSGFYCLMDAEEFGENNERGQIVVRGILGESDVGIGLDDCKFVERAH